MTPYGLTKDGYELQFGTNHLGHFLLVKALLPLIKRSKTKVVVVSSNAHEFADTIHFDQLDNDKNYNLITAYGHSKLANVLFGYELSSQLQQDGVRVNVVHPGFVKSDLRRHVDDYMLKHWLLKHFFPLTYVLDMLPLSTEQGAYTQLKVATHADFENTSGLYVTPIGKISKSTPVSHDKALQSELWKVSQALTSKYPEIEVK